MMKNVTTAIIAGGRSSRYGESKLEVEFAGKRLIDHAVACAGKISPRTFIVGGRVPLPANLPAAVVHDATPEIGPLGGIVTALLYCRDEWLAVMPCDVPLLSPKVYDELFQHRTESRPIVAVSGKGMEPLVSLWPKSALSPLLDAVMRRDYAIRRALRQLNATYHDVTKMAGYDNLWFHNINKKEDLEFLRTSLKNRD